MWKIQQRSFAEKPLRELAQVTRKSGVKQSGKSLVVAVLLTLAAACPVHAVDPPPDPAIAAATITSSVDGSPQKVRYFIPESVTEPIPLLVLLHSWSANVDQDSMLPLCARECQQRGWAIIHPDFRGPNVRPQACASDLAVQDIVDAVRWIETRTMIDPQRRFVAGASGGGHMTLIMAGRHPKLWAAASAWVPITDLAAWHAESTARKSKYADNIAAACGGPPGTSAAVDEQYRVRSPLTYLAGTRGLPVDLNAGITDGHTGSVPISHTLLAFNRLCTVYGQAEVQFSEADIADLTEQQQISPADAQAAPLEAGRMHKVLLRRSAGPARVTIFDGGHEGDMLTAIRWLAEHRRGPAQPR